MALTWPAGELRVVGFCGLAVDGGAGMKPPVFATAAGRFFAGDPDSALPPRFDCDAAELESLAAQGQVTLSASAWPRTPGGVVLYADRCFIQPDQGKLQLDPIPLSWDERAGVHLAYLPRDQALACLRRWGEALLDDARRSLGGRPAQDDLLRALDDAQRARFAAPPPEHPDLRVEMFVQLAVAFEALGRGIDRVLRDARRDFDEATVEEIRRRVRARRAGMPHRPVTRPDPPRRPDPPAPPTPPTPPTGEGKQLTLLRDPADEGRIPIRVRRQMPRAA